MQKSKTILVDLDGTLINTMTPEFSKFRDGKEQIELKNVPLFDGAIDFVKGLKEGNNEVFIVSDSHPRYVNPISEKLFNVKCLSLAYKPNLEKIKEFINQHSSIQLPSSRIFMIGDNPIDIITARKLKIPSILIEHQDFYQPENLQAATKTGPTYHRKGFNEVLDVVNNPLENLLCIEGIKYSSKGTSGSIQIGGAKYRSHQGRRLYKSALARQDMGSCDIFGRSDWYHTFSSPSRDQNFLKKIAEGVGNYINFFETKEDIKFDLLSYISDKKTTVPKDKMKAFAELIEIGIPIEKVTFWRDNIEGSIRNQPKRKKRYDFVNKYLYVQLKSTGQNIVIIDDQITTGATMDAVTEMLWDKGANHVLFINLFSITDELPSDKLCPNCGNEMLIRNRKSDGHRFYSCVPPKYGGSGCGKIENL